ncbi:MAG: P-II family nitrogen regulator [Sphingomonadaceae bacterium]
MIETVTRKRIEILVDSPLVPKIVELIEAAAISGWSQTYVDAGGGRDGQWQTGELTGAAAKSIVIAIASEASAERLIDQLAPILDSYRLLLTISDVSVVRGERF